MLMRLRRESGSRFARMPILGANFAPKMGHPDFEVGEV
jgi:hypothetical protein